MAADIVIHIDTFVGIYLGEFWYMGLCSGGYIWGAFSV